MLKIQEYISLFSNIEEANRYLKSNLGIQSREGSIWTADSMDHLYIYNYHPRKSPKHNPIVKEANGLILNKNNEVVSFPFRRFYDIDHPNADVLDDNGARAKIMENGLLVVIFYYKGYWNVQSEFSVNATETIDCNGFKSRLRYRVIDVLQNKFGIEKPFSPFENYPTEDVCYVFEYVSPYIKKLTSYKKEDLLFISAYNKRMQLEMNDHWLYNWKKKLPNEDAFDSPDSFFVRDRSQVEDILMCLNSFQKGLVIVDNLGNRVKMMNPRYKNLHKLLKAGRNPSTKLLSKMILSGEVLRMGPYYKSYREVLGVFGIHLQRIHAKINRVWHANKHLDQEKFAKVIRCYKKSTRNILFNLKKDEKRTIESCIRGMNPKVLAREMELCYLDELTRELDRLEEVEIED